MEDQTWCPRELGTAIPAKRLITETLVESGRQVLSLPVSVEPPVLTCNLVSLVNNFPLSLACLSCNRPAREQSTSSVAESRWLHTGNRFPGVGCGKKSVPGDRAYPFVQQCFVSRQSEHTHGALSLVVSVASGNTTLARHHGVSRAASQHSSGHRTRRAQNHGARYSLAPTTTMKGRQLDDQCSALKRQSFFLY